MHERIIEVATSVMVSLDLSEQNKTFLSSFLLDFNSSYTSIATAVLPNPGPPVIRTAATLSVRIASKILSNSSDRPITCGPVSSVSEGISEHPSAVIAFVIWEPSTK